MAEFLNKPTTAQRECCFASPLANATGGALELCMSPRNWWVAGWALLWRCALI